MLAGALGYPLGLAYSIALAAAVAATAGMGATAVGFGIIVGSIAGILVIDLTIRGDLFNPIFSTLILFFAILPLLNALIDWVSWGVSRKLGVLILWRGPSIRIIAQHAAIDAALAIVFLTGLTVTLVATIEGYNALALSFNIRPPLELEALIGVVAAHPWGSDGIWVTIMLLSTLVPTAAHGVMLVASGLTLWPGGKRRQRYAALLEGDPHPDQLTRIAWTFVWYWPVATLIFLGSCLGVFWLIAQATEPVSGMLYGLALRTIDLVHIVAY